MADPLDWYLPQIQHPADAIRWACVLEATAPKAGNVFPGRSFANLAYLDFVEAAEITSECFAAFGQSDSLRITHCMLRTVEETAARRKTNVNLGIVLLLGPLVAADQMMAEQFAPRRSSQTWKAALSDVLTSFDSVDGANVFRAINVASAGGLGEVDEMDVHDSLAEIDLVAAMKLASDRDRIARQYAVGFADLFDNIVPVVNESIQACGDLLQGISHAHVRLLASVPDSLISRKNGNAVAAEVSSRARSVDWEDPESRRRFDEALRGPEHQLNPGTTADLIAASLYVLLRTPTS